MRIIICIRSLNTLNCTSQVRGPNPVFISLIFIKAYKKQKGWLATGKKHFLLPWARPLRVFLAWNVIYSWVLCLLAFGQETSSFPVLRPNTDHNFITGSLVSPACQLQIWRLFSLLKSTNQWGSGEGCYWFYFKVNTLISSFNTFSVKNPSYYFVKINSKLTLNEEKIISKIQSGNLNRTVKGLHQTSHETA